jgi:hypothetical protein
VDAIGTDGLRYQIKGRPIARFRSSRQLSAIRNLTGAHFDFLAGVLFNEVTLSCAPRSSANFKRTSRKTSP